MARQTLIHLHTANVENIDARTLAEIELGEIAVMHAATEQALFTKVNDTTLAKFITEKAVEAKIESAQEALQGNIDAVVERVTEVEELLGIGETSGETISSRVEALEGGVEKLTEDLAKEVENREAAVKEVADALAAEVEARGEAETALDEKIKDNADAIEVLNGDAETVGSVAHAVAQEAAAREEADGELQEAIDAINNAETGLLKQAKDYADEKVQALADGAVKANTEAIALLNGNAETEGSVAHAVAQEAAAREAAVSAETAAREAAINTVNSAITAETAAREAADAALDTRVTANATAIGVLQGQVEALNSATHFRGVFESLDAVENPAAGDVVVIKKEGEAQDKEYIYDAEKGWIELGDTTAEQQRLTDAEGRLDAAESKLDVLNGEAEGSVKKALADAKAYTDQEVKSLADGAVAANTAAIAKEVEDRTAAVTAEENARKAGDEALQGQIDTINTTIEENEKVTAEALTDLDTRVLANVATLGEHATAIANNASAITAETAAREEAVEGLQASIDAISVTGSKSYEGGPDSVVVDAAEGTQAYVVKVVGIDCGEY